MADGSNQRKPSVAVGSWQGKTGYPASPPRRPSIARRWCRRGLSPSSGWPRTGSRLPRPHVGQPLGGGKGQGPSNPTRGTGVLVEGGAMPFTQVVSQNGPLPIVVNMTVSAPNQLLLVAGSAYGRDPGAFIVMEVLVDANVVGRCAIYANDPAKHLALVPAFIPLALNPAQSPFAVTLRTAGPATATDYTDQFQVALIE
ncbi:MAG TPA: hypothetical protein VKD71_04130 [Gemmataceae bacterium]|nr:hypothetical protein [Gemmataceae bacterium]